MSEALTQDIAEAKGKTGFEPVEFRGVKYALARKPNALLLAELARTQSGDPEALGTLADFFEATMGKDTYREFKRAALFAEDDVEQDELFELLGQIVEHTLARPTE